MRSLQVKSKKCDKRELRRCSGALSDGNESRIYFIVKSFQTRHCSFFHVECSAVEVQSKFMLLGREFYRK